MAELSTSQARLRERIEAGIALAAPALDALLAFGDRVARITDRDEGEQLPPGGAADPRLLEPPRQPRSGAGNGGPA